MAPAGLEWPAGFDGVTLVSHARVLVINLKAKHSDILTDNLRNRIKALAIGLFNLLII